MPSTRVSFTSSDLLTHWGQVTHICVSKLTIIAPDNGLSPSRRQAIIWTNPGILLIRTLGTNFSELISEMHTFSYQEIAVEVVVWKMAAILPRPQSVEPPLSLDHGQEITST